MATYRVMKPGEEIKVTIDDLTSTGLGVGRADAGEEGRGRAVVFVPGAAPGERVLARIAEARKNHFRAELVELLEPSPDRVKPACPHFGRCPGCSLQYLSYSAQCAAKAARVGRILVRAIGGDFSLPELIPSPEQLGYRTHLSVAVERDGEELRAGFTDPATRRVVDIPDCLLIPGWANERYSVLRDRLRAAEELPKRFRLRLFVDHISREVYVVPPRGPMKSHRRTPRGLGEILAGFPHPRTLNRTVLGVPLRLHPASFIQTNHFLTERLYREGLEAAQPRKKEVACDLYAGSGFFTLALAREVAEVVAVEADRRACDNLSRSAQELVAAARRGSRREPAIHIVQGKAEDLTQELLEKFAPGLVIANPPRSGLHSKVLEAMAGSRGIRRIVMISCDPSTCARDVKGLMRAGFTPERAVLLDCYPQTVHVEIVLPLSRV